MPTDRLEQSGLNRGWINVDASLPIEWQFDGLTRVSDQTPETVARWRAWATGPKESASKVRVRDRSALSMPWPASCGRCEARRAAAIGSVQVTPPLQSVAA
jgi:hypothetical protein